VGFEVSLALGNVVPVVLVAPDAALLVGSETPWSVRQLR
jgi:hypothetical protein